MSEIVYVYEIFLRFAKSIGCFVIMLLCIVLLRLLAVVCSLFQAIFTIFLTKPVQSGYGCHSYGLIKLFQVLQKCNSIQFNSIGVILCIWLVGLARCYFSFFLFFCFVLYCFLSYCCSLLLLYYGWCLCCYWCCCNWSDVTVALVVFDYCIIIIIIIAPCRLNPFRVCVCRLVYIIPCLIVDAVVVVAVVVVLRCIRLLGIGIGYRFSDYNCIYFFYYF